MGIKFLAAMLCAAALGLCGVPSVASANEAPCFSMRGSHGSEVLAAKEKLSSLGYFDGENDDCFDEALFSALLAYQEAHGMRKTGILSAGVLSALGIEEDTDAVSEADFLILCDFLSDVCKGRSYITMSYVASTVINRAKDPRFEDGIAAAVYTLRQAVGVPFASHSGGTPEFLICRTVYEALQCGAAFPGIYFFRPADKAGGLFTEKLPVFSFEGLNFYGD